MKFSITIVCATIATISIAHAGVWSSDTKVATIEASGNSGHGGGVWIRFTADPIPSHTCTNKGGQYRLGGDENNVKQMTTLAISAQLSSRPVRVFWGGSCDPSYPIILGLELR